MSRKLFPVPRSLSSKPYTIKFSNVEENKELPGNIQVYLREIDSDRLEVTLSPTNDAEHIETVDSFAGYLCDNPLFSSTGSFKFDIELTRESINKIQEQLKNASDSCVVSFGYSLVDILVDAYRIKRENILPQLLSSNCK